MQDIDSVICVLSYSRNKSKREGGGLGVGLGYTFFENPPGIFHFFTLPLEISDKTKLSPWIFHRIVLEPLETPRPKTQTPGFSTLFFLWPPLDILFLINPCKFHMLFH